MQAIKHLVCKMPILSRQSTNQTYSWLLAKLSKRIQTLACNTSCRKTLDMPHKHMRHVLKYCKAFLSLFYVACLSLCQLLSDFLSSSQLLAAHVSSSLLISHSLISSQHIFSADLRLSQLFFGPKPGPKPNLGANATQSAISKFFQSTIQNENGKCPKEKKSTITHRRNFEATIPIRFASSKLAKDHGTTCAAKT